MTVQESIEIKASAEKIFSYLLAVENRKDYIPALEEVIMLDPLPIQEGSRYIEVAQIAGRRMETTYQVTTLINNRQLSAKTLKSVFPIRADLILVDQKVISTLQIQLDFQLSGIFRLASGIIRGIVRQQARDILHKLKQNLEEE